MTVHADPVKWAVKAFDDGRNDIYTTYDEYLSGKQPAAFATEAFRTTFGRLFESFAYNRLASVVDAHNDRLQITGFGSDDKGLAQAAQEQWDANQMDIREDEATGDALGFGDAYLVVEKDPRTGDIHYWVNDPRLIRVHYADDRPGHLDLAAKRWIDEDGYGRLTIYTESKVERYITRNKQEGGFLHASTGQWERHDTDDSPWSYTLDVDDTVPVFHLANASRSGDYGVSEIKLLVPLQDAINYVLMSSMVATEFSAFSQKVIMGVQPEDDDEKAMFNEFQVGVRRILTLFDENAKIGEFSPTNLTAYIDLAEFWDTTVSRVSRVPVHYLKGTTASNESGEARRLNEAPFTSKIRNYQRRLGYSYGDALRYGLRLSGMDVPPGAIRVNWQDAAPHSEMDTWEIIRLKQSAGMPFRSALREAGYDPEQIAAILAEQETERLAVQRFLDAGGLDPMPELEP